MKSLKTAAEWTFSKRMTVMNTKRLLAFSASIAMKLVAYSHCPALCLLGDLQRLCINFVSIGAQMVTQLYFKRLPDIKHNYGRRYAGYGKLLSFGMTLQGTLLMVDGAYWLSRSLFAPLAVVAEPNFVTASFLCLGWIIELTSFTFPMDLLYPTMSFQDRVRLAFSILKGGSQVQWVLKNMTTTNLLNVGSGSVPLFFNLLAWTTGNWWWQESIGALVVGGLEM